MRESGFAQIFSFFFQSREFTNAQQSCVYFEEKKILYFMTVKVSNLETVFYFSTFGNVLFSSLKIKKRFESTFWGQNKKVCATSQRALEAVFTVLLLPRLAGGFSQTHAGIQNKNGGMRSGLLFIFNKHIFVF